MAMYRCFQCDALVDNDWHPCTEVNGELHCESCAEEYICEYCGEVMHDEDWKKMGMHLGCYDQAKGDYDYDQMKDRRAENEQNRKLS